MADRTELSSRGPAGRGDAGWVLLRLESPGDGRTWRHHIDAPIHFAKGGQTLDQVPIERLVGTGIRIDVSAQCADNRDTAYRADSEGYNIS